MHFFKDGKTRVIGHRGSPLRALENTLDSFDLAEAEGADGFELDVRLTADGEAIVHHDPDAFFGDRRLALASLTMPELAVKPVISGERKGFVSTLRDVFLRYGPSGRYLVELKPGPTPKPGLLEFRVAALLTQLHLVERSVVLSFSPDQLRRIREIEPSIETCLNFDATAYRPAGRLWPDPPKGCGAIGPHLPLASDRLLEEARAEGIAVHVWTVNDPAVAARLATQGAASVITDDPALIGPVVRGVTGLPAPLDVAGHARSQP